MFCNIPVWKLWLIRTNPETPAIRMKILWIWRQLFIKRSKHQTVRRHSETKRRYHRHTKRQYSRGILKKKIQVICWTTSSKVAISNVKHKSGRIIGLTHRARVPNPNPIYRGKCARGQKFQFLNSVLKHITWPLIWNLMLHWFQKCYSLLNTYTMKIVTAISMLGEKQLLQRNLSHSISTLDKAFSKIAKFIRKWFLFQYTWWKF